MHIIFGQDQIKDIGDRYIVLELDKVRIPGSTDPITAFCLIEMLSPIDFLDVKQWQDLHVNLIRNYRCKNWKFCEDALQHLRGKFNSELDSFYQDLTERVAFYREHDPGPDWQGIIDRS